MTAQTANKTARRTTKRPTTVIAQLVLTALQAAGAIGGGIGLVAWSMAGFSHSSRGLCSQRRGE